MENPAPLLSEEMHKRKPGTVEQTVPDPHEKRDKKMKRRIKDIGYIPIIPTVELDFKRQNCTKNMNERKNKTRKLCNINKTTGKENTVRNC